MLISYFNLINEIEENTLIWEKLWKFMKLVTLKLILKLLENISVGFILEILVFIILVDFW